jgi:hypothetical protein
MSGFERLNRFVASAAHLKASGMAITGTAPEPSPPSNFGGSSNR